MSFKEIKPEELNFNPFTPHRSDWMLLTAGTEEIQHHDRQLGRRRAYSGQTGC